MSGEKVETEGRGEVELIKVEGKKKNGDENEGSI